MENVSRKMQSHRCRILKNTVLLLVLLLLLLLLLTIFLVDFSDISVITDARTAVVNTNAGPVQGDILTTVNSVKYAIFAGIPYAKPPLGYLRFKPPVAADPWTEILNASIAGSECIQYDIVENYIHGSEDCLFINVFTPVVNLSKPPTNLKSVVFWVYGGAFLRGSSLNPTIRPDYFLENDIVFVSLNYRGGIFGYLALGLANATGNAGLKDLVLGLKWLQTNIDKFGGNPNNVTILGASSGAGAVSYLVLSDAAAGLFHGAITMSGSALNTWAYQARSKALSQAQQLGKVMGITWTDKETLLKGFYDASAEEIVIGMSQMIRIFPPFTPTIEDETIASDVFLSECPIAKYNSGKFNKVPQLLGFVDQETVNCVEELNKITELIEQAINAVEESNLSLPDSIIAIKNGIDSSPDFYDNLNYPALRQVINDTSYLVYVGPQDHSRRLLVFNNNNNSVYYYDFSFFVPGPHVFALDNTFPGAGHGDDIPFIFYMPGVNHTGNPAALLTRYRMSTMWSNFVKYGNPTPDWVDDNLLNVTWPPSGTLGLGLDIGVELIVERKPISKNAESWQHWTQPYVRQVVGCE